MEAAGEADVAAVVTRVLAERGLSAEQALVGMLAELVRMHLALKATPAAARQGGRAAGVSMLEELSARFGFQQQADARRKPLGGPMLGPIGRARGEGAPPQVLSALIEIAFTCQQQADRAAGIQVDADDEDNDDDDRPPMRLVRE